MCVPYPDLNLVNMENEGKESQAQEVEDYKVFNITASEKARSRMLVSGMSKLEEIAPAK